MRVMALGPQFLGKVGELLARWFYLLRGYRIVAHNVRSRTGEIDLVARRGGTLVVAEVKTRQSRSAGEGFEAVDRRKRQRLVRLAEELMARQREALQLRYDVLSLQWTGYRFAVTHIPDAFRPVAETHCPWRWRA